MQASDIPLENQHIQNHYLNIPQMQCILADPKELYAHMGRRLGKSTEIIAHLTLNRVHDMPRAAFLLLGRTYKQVLTRTLPGTVHGWEKRGFYEDIHYVIGKRPPSEWPKAFGAPVADYKHYISWYTGTGFHIGSQDRQGLVNSLTVWGIYGDESKLLLEDRFKEDAMPTNSGPDHFFPDNPHCKTVVLTSSMPGLPEGKWLLDMEKRMSPAQIQNILKLAVKMEYLRGEYNQDLSNYMKGKILKKIMAVQRMLNMARRNSVMYAEASTLANIHVLGTDYIKMEQAVLRNFFRTEILSIRPTQTANGFYANLSAANFYVDFNYDFYDRYSFRKVIQSCTGDNDCIKSQPLIIGMDFGPNFNCLITAQYLVGKNELRFLRNHYVSSPDIVDDVVNKWCDYYSNHPIREVRFHHDRTGNNRTGLDRDTYAQRVIKILERRGWQVTQLTQGGSNPRHVKKYLLWNLALPGTDHRFPLIRINSENCEALKTSMEGTKAIDKDGAISKDKSSERKKEIPGEDATHLSDAADTIIFGEFEHLINDDEFASLEFGVR